MSGRLPAAESIDWRRLGNGLGLLLVLAVVFLFVSVAVPQVVGSDNSYVVRSDSMSPAIGAGSVVYVNDVSASAISTDDVITFQRGSERVTHRVVAVVEENGERRFRTKGDANEDPDPELVSASEIVGRVSFHVPYVGYVVTFAQTDLGLGLLVIVPAALLIMMEVRDLLRAANDGDETVDDDSTGDPP
ncbi:signal peptidase I [Halosimplex pelagicum]|uniref:Signal peptidase I n=1 Tax=Halosimplex pelagicum TaxID=869886 RepID=A0A7D5PD79_9EURY|nr:signal peptidase I [Halosimplex pelagicum]QLH84145.1 signal peptidase I [Halosimplex pelagicum]